MTPLSPGQHIGRLYISASEEFLASAMTELRELYATAHMYPLGPDIFAFADEGVSIADVAASIRQHTLAFPRHILRGVAEISYSHGLDPAEVGKAILGAWQTFPIPPDVSLQVWQSGETHAPIRTDVLRRALAELLTSEGYTVYRGGTAHVLGVCMTPGGYIVGSNRAANALSDWPGGRVQLAKPREQISRSEFKLEEVIRTGLAEIPTRGRALDLGAAPGGWTRILLNRGLNVWSVDTGKLHPSLRTRAGLTYVPTLAGPFLAENTRSFDLVVNDMRMEPALSASVMNSAARFVPSGGMGIMSIKLPAGDPLPVLRHTATSLRAMWGIVTVRQLFHNRHEVTAILSRR